MTRQVVLFGQALYRLGDSVIATLGVRSGVAPDRVHQMAAVELTATNATTERPIARADTEAKESPRIVTPYPKQKRSRCPKSRKTKKSANRTQNEGEGDKVDISEPEFYAQPVTVYVQVGKLEPIACRS